MRVRAQATVLLPLVMLALLAGCSGDPSLVDAEPQPEPEPILCTTPFQPKSATHQVVGFYPAWRHDVLSIAEIQWDKLTRIIYAFALPNADGTLDTSDLTQVDALVNAAHNAGVEVFFSIGGGAGSANYPVMAADPATRLQFVQTVRDFMGTHCLDGVDIDWEQWTKDANNAPVKEEKASLNALLRELRLTLEPLGLKLSIDVYPTHWFGQHYDDIVTDFVDYVHVMAYDFSGPWSSPGPHSSYPQAIGSGNDATATGLAYWTNFRGWPKDKILLGVPFYGRDFDNNGGAGITYASILAQYPNAASSDRVANIYYNGLPTITDKTQYVVDNNFPGVMIWEIGQDTKDPATSLLHAIDRVMNP